MTHGIVIGKFYPPHLGHSHLINAAIQCSDQVTVLVCDSPSYKIPATSRATWLQRIHPDVDVRIIPDLDDDDNSKAWANHTINFLGSKPDIVFSSEAYGEHYAAYMQAQHVMVDQARQTIPVAATRIRQSILQEWKYLHEVVKADLALRFVIVGAESTGTTTLATDIAKVRNLPWVPEYGRLYSEAQLHTEHKWNEDDFVHIAATQQSIERHIAMNSNGIIICDTNATATQLWQQRYLGAISPKLQTIAHDDIAHHYIVTEDSIPFVQDGTRDGEHIRHAMHQKFIAYLTRYKLSYTLVSGNREQRLTQALAALDTTTQQYVEDVLRWLPRNQ